MRFAPVVYGYHEPATTARTVPLDIRLETRRRSDSDNEPLGSAPSPLVLRPTTPLFLTS